jgi:hypothetical protein
MKRFRCRSWWFGGPVIAVLAGIASGPLFAQGGAAVTPVPARAHRPLAPGVLHSVDPAVTAEETVGRQDINALVKQDPSLAETATNVAIRRDIWYLQFQYKQLRLIELDIPQITQGNIALKRKAVWYLVYCVTNPGKALHPVKVTEGPKAGTFKIETVTNKEIDFLPGFSLEIPKLDKAYEDKYIPVAIRPISIREDSTRHFYSTLEMSESPIKPNETRWGIATWEAAKWEGQPPADSEGVDPRINRFSIYVSGLTNAYRSEEDPAKVDPNRVGSGRRLTHKVLKLNFSRLGDAFELKESQIHLGWDQEPEYSWVYR